MTQLVTLQLTDPADATPSAVAALLGLPIEALDLSFGVVELSPTRQMYSIHVSDATVERIRPHPVFVGAFPNQRIGPAD